MESHCQRIPAKSLTQDNARRRNLARAKENFYDVQKTNGGFV